MLLLLFDPQAKLYRLTRRPQATHFNKCPPFTDDQEPLYTVHDRAINATEEEVHRWSSRLDRQCSNQSARNSSNLASCYVCKNKWYAVYVYIYIHIHIDLYVSIFLSIYLSICLISNYINIRTETRTQSATGMIAGIRSQRGRLGLRVDSNPTIFGLDHLELSVLKSEMLQSWRCGQTHLQTYTQHVVRTITSNTIPRYV